MCLQTCWTAHTEKELLHRLNLVRVGKRRTTCPSVMDFHQGWSIMASGSM